MPTNLFIYYFYLINLFIGFLVAPAHSESYGDVQLLLVAKDPTRTNIEIFEYMGRTKTSPYDCFFLFRPGLEPTQ